jgi:hypothetical protein
MPILRKPHHEAYAQARARGFSCAQAYREAAGSLGGKHENGHTHGYEWERCRGVKARIAELRAENDRKATLSREQMLEWLTRVIMTGAGSVTPTDSLCQAHKITNGDGWEAHEVKVPDKLGAAQQLARMCDWNSAERIELSMDSLTSYLVELRQQSFIGGRVLELERPALPVESEANGEEEPPRSQ